MVLARGVAEVVVKARDLASRELNKTENRLRALSRVAARVLPVAVATAGVALARLGVEAGKAAQDVLRASDAAGLSSDTYQALAGTLQAAGVSSRALETAMRRLQQTFSDAARGETGAGRLLAQLGIDARDSTGALKSMEEALPEVLEALGLMENQTEAAGIAAKVLGRNWAEVTAALGDSVADYNAVVAGALDSGQIIDRGLLEQGADAANAWDNMLQVLGAVQNTIALQLTPAVESFAAVVNEYFEGTTLRKAAEDDVGGIRELRGELHLLEADMRNMEKTWAVEQGIIDVVAGGSAGYASARAAQELNRMGKINKILQRDPGFRHTPETTRAELMRYARFATRQEQLIAKNNRLSQTARDAEAIVGTAGGTAFLSADARSAFTQGTPDLQRSVNEITRLVEDGSIAANAAYQELEGTQARMRQLAVDNIHKAGQTSSQAAKDVHNRRAAYYRAAEFEIGQLRIGLAERAADERDKAEAEREAKRLAGQRARQAQALQVWDRYYAGLELQREQAFGNEESVINAQATKREEAFKVALKQYREAGASAQMVEEARLQAWQTSTEIWDRQLQDLEHERIIKTQQFHVELLQTDLLGERERLESMIGAHQVQLDEYDRYLAGLEEGTDRYRDIMQERTRIAREQLRLQIDAQHKGIEDGLAIANYGLQAAAAINKKGERESRDQFERRKQIEAGLAAINTAAAAVAVMKNVAQAGGWSPLAIAEMGFILAAGAAQQRAIQSATYAGASGGGGSAVGLEQEVGAVTPIDRARTDVRIDLGRRRLFTVEDIDEIVEKIMDSAARNGGYIGTLQIQGRG